MALTLGCWSVAMPLCHGCPDSFQNLGAIIAHSTTHR